MGDVETMIEIKDKRKLMKYITAFAMGDAGVYRSGKHHRMVSNSICKEYVEWKASILENLTKVNIHTAKERRTDYNRKPLYVLTTRTHPTYDKIRERLYTGSYKGIDPHYLKHLDFEVLAILFMDDGSCYTDKRCDATPRVSINCKRLSYGDQLLLKQAIKSVLGLEFNVNRHGKYWYLSLRTKDYTTFCTGVSPYILECFKYKLHTPSLTKSNVEPSKEVMR